MPEVVSAIPIYKDLWAKAPTAPLSQLLPLTLQLALEIRNQRLENWVRLEVNGYFSGNPALTPDVIVPEYRTIAGQYADQYGRPLVIQDAGLGFVNETRLRNSVAELEEMATRSGLMSIHDPFMAKTLREHLHVEVIAFRFSPASISGVLSGIRAKLLDWLHEIRPDIEAKGVERMEQDLQSSPQNPCIFIGHGHSKLWARVKIFLQDELHISTVMFESESRVGEHTVDVLTTMLKQASFAVLILTAEDETADGRLRARQNVVHEAGLFQGRLGFHRVVMLHQDGLEDFSNVAGLQYISFTGEHIEQTFYELQRVLKREGIIT